MDLNYSVNPDANWSSPWANVGDSTIPNVNQPFGDIDKPMYKKPNTVLESDQDDDDKSITSQMCYEPLGSDVNVCNTGSEYSFEKQNNAIKSNTDFCLPDVPYSLKFHKSHIEPSIHQSHPFNTIPNEDPWKTNIWNESEYADTLTQRKQQNDQIESPDILENVPIHQENYLIEKNLFQKESIEDSDYMFSKLTIDNDSKEQNAEITDSVKTIPIYTNSDTLPNTAEKFNKDVLDIRFSDDIEVDDEVNLDVSHSTDQIGNKNSKSNTDFQFKSMSSITTTQFLSCTTSNSNEEREITDQNERSKIKSEAISTTKVDIPDNKTAQGNAVFKSTAIIPLENDLEGLKMNHIKNTETNIYEKERQGGNGKWQKNDEDWGDFDEGNGATQEIQLTEPTISFQSSVEELINIIYKDNDSTVVEKLFESTRNSVDSELVGGLLSIGSSRKIFNSIVRPTRQFILDPSPYNSLQWNDSMIKEKTKETLHGWKRDKLLKKSTGFNFGWNRRTINSGNSGTETSLSLTSTKQGEISPVDFIRSNIPENGIHRIMSKPNNSKETEVPQVEPPAIVSSLPQKIIPVKNSSRQKEYIKSEALIKEVQPNFKAHNRQEKEKKESPLDDWGDFNQMANEVYMSSESPTPEPEEHSLRLPSETFNACQNRPSTNGNIFKHHKNLPHITLPDSFTIPPSQSMVQEKSNNMVSDINEEKDINQGHNLQLTSPIIERITVPETLKYISSMGAAEQCEDSNTSNSESVSKLTQGNHNNNIVNFASLSINPIFLTKNTAAEQCTKSTNSIPPSGSNTRHYDISKLEVKTPNPSGLHSNSFENTKEDNSIFSSHDSLSPKFNANIYQAATNEITEPALSATGSIEEDEGWGDFADTANTSRIEITNIILPNANNGTNSSNHTNTLADYSSLFGVSFSSPPLTPEVAKFGS